jgi:hypothetical protein
MPRRGWREMLSLEEYLAVPYVTEAWSEQTSAGWMCRARLPEMPHCEVSGFVAIEVLEELDRMRIEAVRSRFAAGDYIPVPRPPLRSVPATPARSGPVRDTSR